METLLPRAATPRRPDGRADCLSRRQLDGPTPISHERAAPVAPVPLALAHPRPETTHEADR